MANVPNQPDLPQGLGVPAHLQQMFQQVQQPEQPQGKPPFLDLAANQYGPAVGRRITKGSLIWFRYTNYIHDPFPLVIITDIWQNHIRGFNLHYLTFFYVKKLLSLHCDNMMFSYFLIKSNPYFRVFENSFRTYKRLGMKQVKKLDCSFLLNVLGSIMSFDPAEVEQMRVYVRERLAREAHPRAERMTERYTQMPPRSEGFEMPQKMLPTPPEPGGN